jgi:hypothetical protein
VTDIGPVLAVAAFLVLVLGIEVALTRRHGYRVIRGSLAVGADGQIMFFTPANLTSAEAAFIRASWERHKAIAVEWRVPR